MSEARDDVPEGEPGDGGPTVDDIAGWSDQRLEDEVTRRRRQRLAARGGTTRDAHRDDVPRGRSAPRPTRGLAQAYANLELSPGSPLDEVRRRYLELLDRYEPSRFEGDRRRMAEGLVAKLQDAYETVRNAVGAGRRDRSDEP